jgi:hypothetical protein
MASLPTEADVRRREKERYGFASQPASVEAECRRREDAALEKKRWTALTQQTLDALRGVHRRMFDATRLQQLLKSDSSLAALALRFDVDAVYDCLRTKYHMAGMPIDNVQSQSVSRLGLDLDPTITVTRLHETMSRRPTAFTTTATYRP